MFRHALFQAGLTPMNVYDFTIRMKLDKLLGAMLSEDQIMRSSKMPGQIGLSFSDVDWSKSIAYSFGSGQVYINMRGREPEGVVREVCMSETVKRIKKALSEAVDPNTGQKLFERVLTKYEVYQGSCMTEAPDIVLEPKASYSFFLHPFVSNTVLGRPVDKSADHRIRGIFMISGPGVKKGLNGESVQSIDITPTVLYLMGVPIPRDVDGRVLTDLLLDTYVQTHPIQIGPISDRYAPSFMAPEEEEQVENRLRKLGYI